jgi:hypothetical protein
MRPSIHEPVDAGPFFDRLVISNLPSTGPTCHHAPCLPNADIPNHLCSPQIHPDLLRLVIPVPAPLRHVISTPFYPDTPDPSHPLLLRHCTSPPYHFAPVPLPTHHRMSSHLATDYPTLSQSDPSQPSPDLSILSRSNLAISHPTCLVETLLITSTRLLEAHQLATSPPDKAPHSLSRPIRQSTGEPHEERPPR